MKWMLRICYVAFALAAFLPLYGDEAKSLAGLEAALKKEFQGEYLRFLPFHKGFFETEDEKQELEATLAKFGFVDLLRYDSDAFGFGDHIIFIEYTSSTTKVRAKQNFLRFLKAFGAGDAELDRVRRNGEFIVDDGGKFCFFYLFHATVQSPSDKRTIRALTKTFQNYTKE